jgi:hypothetical protein
VQRWHVRLRGATPTALLPEVLARRVEKPATAVLAHDVPFQFETLISLPALRSFPSNGFEAAMFRRRVRGMQQKKDRGRR